MATSSEKDFGIVQLVDLDRPMRVINYSRMTQVSQAAAELLSQGGMDAGVIGLRSLRPLSTPILVESATPPQRFGSRRSSSAKRMRR